jgi:hypothetical protein
MLVIYLNKDLMGLSNVHNSAMMSLFVLYSILEQILAICATYIRAVILIHTPTIVILNVTRR